MKKSKKVKRSTRVKRVVSDVPIPPAKKVNVLPKVIVILSVLLLLVLVALVYRLSSVGRAITVETPYLGVIDLNKEGSADVNILKVPMFDIKVKSSDKTNDYILHFNLTTLSNGMINYRVNITEQVNSLEVVVASGTLSDLISSFDFYLPDQDDKFDLHISYNAGYLQVVNPYYVEPDVSQFIVYNIKDNKMELQDGKLFYVAKNQNVSMLFNVSSTKTPIVTAQWGNGTNLTASAFWLNWSNATYAVMNLNFIPTEEKPYVLHVSSAVDTKVTDMTYVFAVGNILYASAESKYPDVVFNKMKDGFNATITFEVNSLVQPFSVPCNSNTLLDGSYTIKTYDNGIKQWKKGVPPDFSTLSSGKGFVLELTKDSTEKSLTVVCPTVVGIIIPPDTLPTLHSDWNLIGIPGYQTVTLKQLQKKAPYGSSISKVYVITIEGNVFLKDPVFEPGKAYWVYVE